MIYAMLSKNAVPCSNLYVLLRWCTPLQIVKIIVCYPLPLHRTFTFEEVVECISNAGLRIGMQTHLTPDALIPFPLPLCLDQDAVEFETISSKLLEKGLSLVKTVNKKLCVQQSRWWALPFSVGGGTHLPRWLGSLQGPCLSQGIAIGTSLVCMEENYHWIAAWVFVRPMGNFLGLGLMYKAIKGPVWGGPWCCPRLDLSHCPGNLRGE